MTEILLYDSTMCDKTLTTDKYQTDQFKLPKYLLY